MNIADLFPKGKVFAEISRFLPKKGKKPPGTTVPGAKKRKFCIGSAQPETAYEICIVVAGGQIAGDDAAVSGGRGVHVLAVADVDTGVGAGLALVAAGIIEEHQVAGLQFGNAVDLGAHAAEPLAGSGVGQRIAELLINVHGEPPAEAPPYT